MSEAPVYTTALQARIEEYERLEKVIDWMERRNDERDEKYTSAYLAWNKSGFRLHGVGCPGSGCMGCNNAPIGEDDIVSDWHRRIWSMVNEKLTGRTIVAVETKYRGKGNTDVYGVDQDSYRHYVGTYWVS